jgi:hypothetical protein
VEIKNDCQGLIVLDEIYLPEEGRKVFNEQKWIENQSWVCQYNARNLYVAKDRRNKRIEGRESPSKDHGIQMLCCSLWL